MKKKSRIGDACPSSKFLFSNLVNLNKSKTINLDKLSVILPTLIGFFILINLQHISGQNIQNKHHIAYDDVMDIDGTNFCVIGRLRMCNDDEDCLELDRDQKTIYTLPFGQKPGICICRDQQNCKRKLKDKPTSDQLSTDSSKNGNSNKHSTFRLIMGSLSCLSVICFISFVIYYYGIRYNGIRNMARRFGLLNRNTLLDDDDQLLDQIGSINNPDDNQTNS